MDLPSDGDQNPHPPHPPRRVLQQHILRGAEAPPLLKALLAHLQISSASTAPCATGKLISDYS